MLNRIRRWLSGEPVSDVLVARRRLTGIEVISSTDKNFDIDAMDPLMLAAINRCRETGEAVFGSRDDDGNISLVDDNG